MKNLLFLIACLGSSTLYAATPCTALKGATVSATDIGLPTRGAVVLSAKQKATWCELRGEIRSVDPAADPIRFALALPTAWNGKAAQFGGGVFDGYIPDVTKQPVLGDKATATPLAQGYATFASDSGHHHRYLLLPDKYNALSARFALNDEQRLNFASQHIKKNARHRRRPHHPRLRSQTCAPLLPRRLHRRPGSHDGRR